MSRNKIHSLLFVPAKAKMLDKIAISTADAWIIDLEDSIAHDEKDVALSAAVNFLRVSHRAEDCFVRIDREFMAEEVNALQGLKLRGFMVPKVEDCDFIDGFKGAFEGRENIALIETPRGLVEINSIANNKHIAALAFGAEDYTAAVNMQNTDGNLTALKSRIIMYAKAYGKDAYDTPSFGINDVVKADAEAQRSADLGFDGKMAIHPKLISGINRAFKMHDIERMRQIVFSYEKRGEAVLVLDGNVYEKMHIDRFRRIIRESQGL